MELKKVLERNPNLKFVVDKLELYSGLSRKYLYASRFKTQIADIELELNLIEHIFALLKNPAQEEFTSKIKIKLMQFKDVNGSIRNLSTATVLDDVELFELKHFSLLQDDVRQLLALTGTAVLDMPSLEKVIAILDPQNQRIPVFYIYDEYSSKLTEIRKEYKTIKHQEDSHEYVDVVNSKADMLFQQSLVLEDEIREKLTQELSKHKETLKEAIDKIAHLDILIAKAEVADKLDLTKPEISKETTILQGLFNPQLKELLQSKGKDFQAVDICIPQRAHLITGANMAGKTVLLKSIALAQYLMQFGFYVPASYAGIVPVEEVVLCISDDQSELAGLSSFAAEMMNVNSIIQLIRKKKKIFVLIDELARTTNPVEGTAFVASMLELLEENKVRSLITTHYSGIETNCRKLRVKGFIREKLNTDLTIDNINDYIDYSLVEEQDQIVPMEALQIAALLNVDASLLERAHSLMKKTETK